MWISRIGSIIAAIILIVITWETDVSLADTASHLLFLLVPLALIWFPEFFGDYVVPTRGISINNPTSAFLVSAAGWFFLVGIPLVVWSLR